MRRWLACLAWRLVGFKVLPVGRGDLVIVEVHHPYSYKALEAMLEALRLYLRARGAALVALPPDIQITTVLHNRAHFRERDLAATDQC